MVAGMLEGWKVQDFKSPHGPDVIGEPYCRRAADETSYTTKGSNPLAGKQPQIRSHVVPYVSNSARGAFAVRGRVCC